MSELNHLIDSFSNTAAYPGQPRGVRVIQTQMSVVFLTDEFVYKIKKPVNLGYVDYTQLERRKYYCEREVALNRRLSSAVYLGVVPITANGNQLVLEGTGTPVEYAVKMRHLPDDRLLDNLLRQNKATDAMMAQVAAKVADFHRSAETNEEIAQFGRLEAITRNIEENFIQTEKYIGRAISPEQFTTIRNYARHFLQENEGLFAQRVSEGRVRDCHGDLHAQHVCFCQDLYIFDCIEFNERFRYSDTAAEVAFLTMDLEHSGRADLARSFVDTYIAKSGDNDLTKLLSFYKCYRAYVRGKVNCFKLDDPYISEGDRSVALATAQGYFDLAAAYTRTKPLLIITMGFAGTGKTTLALELAGRLGAVYLSSDVTRKNIAGIPLTEHRYREPEEGIYSADFTRRTYDTLYQEAAKCLAAGYPVILDAAFLKAHERAEAQQIATQAGADFYILECFADPNTVKARLDARQGQTIVSDGHWEIYLKQQEWFERPNTNEPTQVTVDTSQPLGQNVRQVLSQITGLGN